MQLSTVRNCLVALLLAHSALGFFIAQQNGPTTTVQGAVASVALPDFSKDLINAQINSWQMHGSPDRREVYQSNSLSDVPVKTFNVSPHISKKNITKSLKGLNFNYSKKRKFPFHSKSDKIQKLRIEALIRENKVLKEKDAENCKKIEQLEERIRVLLICEKKVLELEKLVAELRSNLSAALKDAENWKSQWTIAVAKIMQLEELIKKLYDLNSELKNKNEELVKKLADALCKLNDFKEALEKANHRLRYFAALKHKYLLRRGDNSKSGKSNKHSRKSKHSSKSRRASKKNDKRDDNKSKKNDKKEVSNKRRDSKNDPKSRRSAHHTKSKKESRRHNKTNRSKKSSHRGNAKVRVGLNDNSKKNQSYSNAVLVGGSAQ
jgi:hypothetical protein